MMRKSHYVTILLGGAAAVALWNVGSSQPKSVAETVYGDVQSCTADGTSTEVCTQAMQEAKEEHVRTAPKFASAAECEAAGFAKCEEAPKEAGQTSSSQQFSFMPMMMGYMMGSMMGRMGGGGFGQGMQPGPAGAPAGATAGARAGQPVYADRAGYLRSGNAQVGRVAPGTTSLGSRSVARGGFGSSASRIGGGS